MKPLSDAAVAHLRRMTSTPDLTGTRYQLMEEIGRGGMGVVYLARDTELGREVALKVFSEPGPAIDGADRLLREARILAQLEHPGIVPVHDVGTLPDGRLFYVMKRIRGTRLDAHARTIASISELLRLFERICEPVAFAHAHGIIHRDLKPENIMIGPFGEVLVMDWGVAKLGADRVCAISAPLGLSAGPGSGPGAILGTPGYMAPEQAAGTQEVDERADVFALGAILHVLLTQRLPGADPPRRLNPAVPKPVEAICLRALEPNPLGRYPTVPALAAEVNRFLNGERVQAHAEQPLERLARVAARHRAAIALVLAYLVVRIFIIVFGHI
jgi:serine/threonine protein kinase